MTTASIPEVTLQAALIQQFMGNIVFDTSRNRVGRVIDYYINGSRVSFHLHSILIGDTDNWWTSYTQLEICFEDDSQ